MDTANLGERLYFTLNDSERDKNRRALVIKDADKYNSTIYKRGIFWTVNEFKNASNVLENCTKLVSWYADLDNITLQKDDLLYNAQILPTMIVKTKGGYHSYWHCKDATMANYALLNKRLTYCFTKKASVHDVSRILRVPGYLHWKNPAEPFKCEIIWQLDVAYTEKQLLWACQKKHPDEEKLDDVIKNEVKYFSSGDDFFAWLAGQNQKELLEQLSGTDAVCYEKYSFRLQRNGKYAIYVNDTLSASWIDVQGRIGSHAKGGPLVYNWLRYFGFSPREATQKLKEKFAWKKTQVAF